MKKIVKEICECAIETNGPAYQMDKAIEEMGELTTAIIQFREGRATPKAVRSEIADVLVTMCEMALIFGEEEVMKEMRFKLLRLAQRLKMELEYIEGL